MTWKHGVSGYTAYGCHCEICTEANRIRTARAKRRRYAARELVDGIWVATRPDLQHGTYNAYQAWGCRCQSCTEANRAAYHERKDRMKARRAALAALTEDTQS